MMSYTIVALLDGYWIMPAGKNTLIGNGNVAFASYEDAEEFANDVEIWY